MTCLKVVYLVTVLDHIGVVKEDETFLPDVALLSTVHPTVLPVSLRLAGLD